MAEGKGNFLYFQSSLFLFGPMIKEIEILLSQPYLVFAFNSLMRSFLEFIFSNSPIYFLQILFILFFLLDQK